MIKLALLILTVLGASWTSSGPGVSGSINLQATITSTASLTINATELEDGRAEIEVIASSTGFPEARRIHKKYIVAAHEEMIVLFDGFDGRDLDIMTVTAYAALFKNKRDKHD